MKQIKVSEELQDYLVQYEDKYTILSKTFLENNNAHDNLELIKDLFKTKFKYYCEIEKTDDSNKLKELVESIKENEFEIQKAFNFEPNENYHRFWQTPKCQCPSMDNSERWGLSVGFIINKSCPLHGDE